LDFLRSIDSSKTVKSNFMKSLFRKPLHGALKVIGINQVLLGKNRGLKMRYKSDLNLDMLIGLHEPNTFEVFDLFVKEGMLVADIGANIGYFSRFLSKKVGEKGGVHAFEPIPTTFQSLQETIILNKLHNITAVNKAIVERNGSVRMFLSNTHYMASVDVNWATEAGGEMEVPATSLDFYFGNLGKYPDFIKMDIEGGGVQALKGTRNCIIKNEPILLLESHTPSEDLAIGAALSLIPYNVFRVGDTRPVKYLDRNHQDEFGIYGTVVGIPKSKQHMFTGWTPAQFQKRRLGQRRA
jgi:FkbM family methyltransferase